MTGYEGEQPIPDVTPAQPINMVSLRTDKNPPVGCLERKPCDLVARGYSAKNSLVPPGEFELPTS